MLIRDMGKSKAIIVSTHILEEVEAICSRVIIIDQGKLVFNGSPAELKARSNDAGAVQVRVHGVPYADISSALGAIAGAGDVSKLGADGQAVTVLVQRQDPAIALAPAIKAVLDGKHWQFDELHTETGRLDDVFRTITSLDSAKENKA